MSVIQFPREKMPVGAAHAQLLIDNFRAIAGTVENLRNSDNPPSEGDMVTEDGDLVPEAIERVSRWRAISQWDRCTKKFPNLTFVFTDILADERKVNLASAQDIACIRKARKQVQALPLREQLIRSLEYELYKAEKGMGMPYDADRVARLKLQIAAYRFPTAQE